MRGRPGCPTEQEKTSVEATGGSPPFFISTRKGWVLDRPLIRPSVRTGAPSPRGEGFGGGKDPSRLRNPPFPARPAGGRAVTGVGSWAAGQAEKKRGPLQGPPNQKRWVQGGRTSSSLVFFPPAFFQRKPGSPAGVGGGGIPPLPEPTQHGRGLPHPGGLLLHHRRHPGGLLGGHCRAVYLPERRYPLPHPAGHDPLCPPGGF
mgnify:CR=1 FL=1